jgi:Anti-sigma-28 factor, FlgM.
MIKIQSEPEIRTDLVEKYKNQIKSGEYKIDNKKLSSKLIKDSVESGM